MNKIDEYKKKINYDVWEDITNLPRKLFQEGIIQYHNTNSTNTVPREGFFLGGIKKRLRKLIPNELANFAVKAAPFVAPFQPGIAAAMRGIGRFHQRGSVSDALKQGLGTYALGRGARFLTGAEGARGGPSTFSMDRFREGPVGRLFKGTETNIGDVKKNINLGNIF